MRQVSGEGTEVKYLKAPTDHTPHDRNPFTSDGNYGPSWAGLSLVKEGTTFIGTSRSGLFYYQYDIQKPVTKATVADFLRYENGLNRTPVFFCAEDLDLDAFVVRALDSTPPAHIVRDVDPEHLVHSTDIQAGKSILRDGEIKAFSRLVREGRSPDWHKLRSDYSLGEPLEYANYVNLGAIESPWVETVPASHTAGRFLTPEDEYEPGMRFYFDGHKIIRAGLDVRVPGATIKVLDSLPLGPFLVEVVRASDVDLPRRTGNWTSTLFTEAANKAFSRSFCRRSWCRAA